MLPEFLNFIGWNLFNFFFKLSAFFLVANKLKKHLHTFCLTLPRKITSIEGSQSNYKAGNSLPIKLPSSFFFGERDVPSAAVTAPTRDVIIIVWDRVFFVFFPVSVSVPQEAVFLVLTRCRLAAVH